MNKWTYNHHAVDEYYDFEKELYVMPDEGKTSVDMRLTFNTETRTCAFHIMLRNDDGNTRDWEQPHYVPWAAGLAMLGDEVDVPEELT